jgi:hypothetical protein
MATQSRNDKVVRIDGMSVAGGDLSLPKGHKYFINLELDYSDVEFEKAIELASGGSSVRVQSQAKLRVDEETLKKHGIVAESLEDAEGKGLKDVAPVKFDVGSDFEAERGPRDKEKAAVSAFKKASIETRITLVMETLKITREEALAMMPKNEE